MMTREELQKIMLKYFNEEIEKVGENSLGWTINMNPTISCSNGCMYMLPRKYEWTLKEVRDAIENDKCLCGYDINLIDIAWRIYIGQA